MTRALGLTKGPISYVNRMNSDQRDDYKQKMAWFKQQEDVGRLKRGWKRQVADSPLMPYSYVMLVNVLNGKEISPPVLDAAYEAASKLLGEQVVPEYDSLGKLDYTENMLKLVQDQVDRVRFELETVDQRYTERIEQLKQAHEMARTAKALELEKLEAHLAKVKGEHESLQMRVEDEYGWSETPDWPAEVPSEN